jgi:REP element-mobilizing transposase RayT
MPDRPLAYFITFTTYGTWLHGDEASSVDREHNLFGAPPLEADPQRLTTARGRMTQEAYTLDEPRRVVVRDAIVEECQFRGWDLLALHVRSNHVHLVVTADGIPEFVMRSCKSLASKRLTQSKFEDRDRKRWTSHGSTRYLWHEDAVAAAVEYTLHQQGEPMAVFDGTGVGNGNQVPGQSPSASEG